MPYSTYGPDERRAIEDVLDSDRPSDHMHLEYVIGGEDVTDDVLEASWGRPAEDRPALEFSGRFKTELSPDVRNEPLHVNLHVAGYVYRRFTGRVLRVGTGGGLGRARSEVQAVTAGYWLDKIRLDENRSYVGMEPGDVVLDVVARNNRYNVRNADVNRTQGPLFNRSGSFEFNKISKLYDVLSAVVEESDLFYRDSPLNAPMCSKDIGPAEVDEYLYEYEVGENIDAEEWLPESTGDEYYDVVVYRDVDGQIVYPFNPIGVPGSSAPVGAGYEIELSEASDDSINSAYTTALLAAKRLSDGEATQSINVEWIHPLMLDGDFIVVSEPLDFQDEFRRVTRKWIAKVMSQAENHLMEHTINLLMVRGSEEEARRTVVRFGRSRSQKFALKGDKPIPPTVPAVAFAPLFPGDSTTSDATYPSDFTYPWG